MHGTCIVAPEEYLYKAVAVNTFMQSIVLHTVCVKLKTEVGGVLYVVAQVQHKLNVNWLSILLCTHYVHTYTVCLICTCCVFHTFFMFSF